MTQRIAGRSLRPAGTDGDQIRSSPQLWPPIVDPATLTRQVWDQTSALGVPGLARGLNLFSGLLAQCALDRYHGDTLLSRPQLLDLPDPMLRSLALFTRVHVNDYLVNGNALHLVTARNPDTGWPASTRWFPAELWGIDGSVPGFPDYYLNGTKIARREDVVHVQWGAAPGFPARGWGVVERHLSTLNRAGLQEAAEEQNLAHGGVPSVAVIAPQKRVDQQDIDEAGEAWERKFSGPGRRPGLFPNGTQIVPLSFSAEQQDAVLARQMTLIDLANILNCDPYWLGHPGSSHNYKTPGPMFLVLQRTSLEPIMMDLEQTWSLSWLPPGERASFERNKLTRDDFASSIETILAAVAGKLMTREEGRVYMGWTAEPTLGSFEEEPAPPAIEAGNPRLQLVAAGNQDTQDEGANG